MWQRPGFWLQLDPGSQQFSVWMLELNNANAVPGIMKWQFQTKDPSEKLCLKQRQKDIYWTVEVSNKGINYTLHLRSTKKEEVSVMFKNSFSENYNENCHYYHSRGHKCHFYATVSWIFFFLFDMPRILTAWKPLDWHICLSVFIKPFKDIKASPSH